MHGLSSFFISVTFFANAVFSFKSKLSMNEINDISFSQQQMFFCQMFLYTPYAIFVDTFCKNIHQK